MACAFTHDLGSMNRHARLQGFAGGVLIRWPSPWSSPG